MEMTDGIFYRREDAADELDVSDVVDEPTRLLHGRFSPARRQWEQSRQALADRKYELAVQQGVNALESVVRVASGESKISAGLKKLFPTGERAPLVAAINQLHNYGSAMPGVRHGGDKMSDLTSAEARGVCRAAAVWMSMLIDLDGRDLSLSAAEAQTPARLAEVIMDQAAGGRRGCADGRSSPDAPRQASLPLPAEGRR